MMRLHALRPSCLSSRTASRHRFSATNHTTYKTGSNRSHHGLASARVDGWTMEDVRHEVQVRTLTVSGAPTEVVCIPASKGPAKLQVLLIPGNPGSARYYIEHLQQLHHAMDGEVEVVSISHAGHAPEFSDGPGNKMRSIEEQIQQKADFMRQHLLQPGRPPLVVAGHSIGAFIAAHAVQNVESDPANHPRILKVIALMGFFWIDKTSWEIKVMRLLSAGYEVMGGVAFMLSLLPRGAQSAVVRYVSGGGMDKDAEDLTRELLVYSSVRNNFYMAHTEFRILDQPCWPLLRGLGSRLHILGCPNDFWFPRAQYEEMLQQVDGLQATWIEDVGHAYCTSRIQCVRVSEFMQAILYEALDSLEPKQERVTGASGGAKISQQ